MPEVESGTGILNLGEDFPPVSTATWEAAIAKDLKGADYEKKTPVTKLTTPIDFSQTVYVFTRHQLVVLKS